MINLCIIYLLKGISIALEQLGISDCEIEKINVASDVSSKPVDNDILSGAMNRNLINYLDKNNKYFDYVIFIEGGYEEINNKYFIVTYASIIDKNNNEYVGKSVGLEITEAMFLWVKKVVII